MQALYGAVADATRDSVDTRAFWQWAALYVTKYLPPNSLDDVWELVPGDLKTDRDMMLLFAQHEPMWWEHMGPFGHDVDFLSALGDTMQRTCDGLLHDLLRVFRPCFERRDVFLWAAGILHPRILNVGLRKDHWFRSDTQVATQLVAKYGPAIGYFVPRVCEAVWRATLQHPHVDVRHLPREAFASRDLVLQLAGKSAETLRRAPHFAGDPEVALRALLHDNDAYAYIHSSLRTNRDFVLDVARALSNVPWRRGSQLIRLTELWAHVDAEILATVVTGIPNKRDAVFWIETVLQKSVAWAGRLVETVFDDVKDLPFYTTALAKLAGGCDSPDDRATIEAIVANAYRPGGPWHTRVEKRSYAAAFG